MSEMFTLSQDYYLRKCFLQREQVPTQGMIRNKMSPALANIYFKSMSPKVKVIAGLEPPMKGGGSEWYVPPNELLQGRTVLKPIKKKYLDKLSFTGINDLGEKIVEAHHKQWKAERKRVIHESDRVWKEKLDKILQQEWRDCCAKETKFNSRYIQTAFRQFSALYTKSLNNYQDLILDASVDIITKSRDKTVKKKQAKYKYLSQKQETMLRDKYTKAYETKKAQLKNKFLNNLEISRTALGDKLHDINLDKHVAVEKVRNYLECQNLACRVYVAMKEREECLKEMDLAKHEHVKVMKTFNEEIMWNNIEIHIAEVREKQQQEFNTKWMTHICRIIQKFQRLISYCLNVLPEQAEFFINLEKLMLLQLGEVLVKPNVESIFSMDCGQLTTPIPKPYPFYLFCDKKIDTDVNKNLCPKHCTSSASQLPVVVVNKRCIYAACDNFEQFTDKIKPYIEGQYGDDTYFEDPHDYSIDVPVEYTASQQLHELELESSLLQVLQQKIANIKNIPLECPNCKITHCFCSSSSSSTSSQVSSPIKKQTRKRSSLPPLVLRDKQTKQETEKLHTKDPKWGSLQNFIKCKKCECSKTTKKTQSCKNEQALEYLPAYMKKPPRYASSELPNYEMCTMHTLKTLVKNARGKMEVPLPQQEEPSNKKDMATQWSDHEFDYLCTCFSDDDEDQCIKDTSTYIEFGLAPNDENVRILTNESKRVIYDKMVSLRLLID